MALEARLARYALEALPAAAARILESLPEEETARLLASAGGETAGELCARMDPGAAARALVLAPPERARAVLETLPLAAAARLLRRMDSAARERLASSLPPEREWRLRRALAEREGEAARLMDPAVTALPEERDVAEALARVRERRQAVPYLYLTDGVQVLSGALGLADLLRAAPQERLGALARRPVQRLHVGDDATAILAHPGWRKYHALPVVDDAGSPVGVLPYAALRALQERTREERPADLMVLGATLGEAWTAMAATLLDGWAASLASARERRDAR